MKRKRSPVHAPALSVPTFARLDEYIGVWAVEQRAFVAQWDAISRMDLAAHVAQGAQPVHSAIEKAPLRVSGKSIAVIRILGSLMKGESSMGGTSTVRLRRDIRAAAADADVAAILLAIDSPGGTVAGTDDLAKDVRAARKKKPVFAHIDDLAASAAYWIASQCEQIFANSPTALVGSIGTIMTVYDYSAAAEKEGIKALVFATGPLKGAGVEGTKVTDEQAAYFQNIIDQSQKTFDEAVKSGRKLNDKQLAEIRTGAVFSATEALEHKLIDGIQSFEATMDALAAAARKAQAAADKQAKVSTPVSRMEAKKMEFSTWVKSQGFDPDTLSAEQEAFLRKAFEAHNNPTDVRAELRTIGQQFREEMRREQAADSQRVADIRRVCAQAGNPQTKITADGQTRTVSVEAHAIAEGWDLARAELECLRVARPAVSPVTGSHDQASMEELGHILQASLCLSAGIKEDQVGRWFDQKVMNLAVSREHRGASIASVMGAVIEAAGMRVRAGRVNDRFIRTAYEADKQLKASGFTTLSLSGILGNTANKALIAAYQAVETTWQKFCAIRNHSDFKVWTRYRLDSTGAFKKVAADGELKHIGLAEASYTNQLATYGCMIALTRQMQINDDLEAFLALPKLIGRMGSLRIEEAVYVLLLSNPSSFFHANNRNYMTGATTNLSVTSLTTAEQKFVDQVDSNNKPILAPPKVLVAGSALKTPSENLFAKELLIASSLGSTSSKVLESSKNPHEGKYPPVISPYINNSNIKDQDGAAITGQSSTRWYLFADPLVLAAIAVAFLDGQQTPIIEDAETDFSTLGMQWRAYEDFGVGMEDPTGAVMSDGA